MNADTVVTSTEPAVDVAESLEDLVASGPSVALVPVSTQPEPSITNAEQQVVRRIVEELGPSARAEKRLNRVFASLANTRRSLGALKAIAAKSIQDVFGEIVHDTIRHNRAVVLRNFLIGCLLIAMKRLLTNPTGRRRNLEAFTMWRANVFPHPWGERVLQQAVNIAEMGSLVLDIADVGKYGVLEVRWILMDMPEIRALNERVTSEILRQKLAALMAQLALPSLQQLAPDEYRDAVRWYVDTLGTWQRLINAGIDPSVFTMAQAQSIARQLRKALEKKDAEAIAHALESLPDPSQRAETFSAIMMDGLGHEGTQHSNDPTRLIEKTSWIVQWGSDWLSRDAELAVLLETPDFMDELAAAQRVLDTLQQKLEAIRANPPAPPVTTAVIDVAPIATEAA